MPERPSHCIKKNGNGVPVRSRRTRTLVGADGDGFDVCRDEWGMGQKSYSCAGL